MKNNNPKQAGKVGQTQNNPSARSRRKLLRALGGTGGVALGAIMTSGWEKPLVESALLPAHAESSPSACTSLIDFSSFAPASYASSYVLNALVSNSNGTTAIANANGGFVFPSSTTSVSGSSTFPPGTYMVGVQAFRSTDNFPTNFPFTESMTGAYGVSCCDGSNTLFQDSFDEGGTMITDVLPVNITDDGTCELLE